MRHLIIHGLVLLRHIRPIHFKLRLDPLLVTDRILVEFRIIIEFLQILVFNLQLLIYSLHQIIVVRC